METNFELIEDYLTHTLPAAQHQQVVERMKTDKAFAQEVGFYLAARHTIRKSTVDQRKAEWKALYKQEGRSKPMKWGRAIAIGGGLAAAACLVFVLWNVVFSISNSASPETYASNYVKQELAILPMQMGSTADSLQLAVELYNDNKLAAAKDILSKLPTTAKTTEYQGVISLRQGNFAEALLQFKALEQYTDELVNKAVFYQAITLIEDNRLAEAKVLLEELKANPEAFGHAEAVKLLDAW